MANRRVTFWLDYDAYVRVRDALHSLPGRPAVGALVGDFLRSFAPVAEGLAEAVRAGDQETIRAFMDGFALDSFTQLGHEYGQLQQLWDAESGEEESTDP